MSPAEIRSPTTTKQPRLYTSCNWCRSHKLKCDTEQPSCKNCRRRAIECVTTDLRKPGSIGRRVEPAGRHRKRHPEMMFHCAAERPSRSCNHTTTSPASSSLQQKVGSLEDSPAETLHADCDLPIFSLPFNLRDQEDGDPDRSGSRMQMQRCRHSTLSSGCDGSCHHHGVSGDVRMVGGKDLTILTDNSPGRLQMMGSSSSLYILVQWLDLFFAQRADWLPIFPYFRHGMAYTVEMPLPFPVSLPRLPPVSEQEEYISIFSARIQPIFPVLDLDEFRETLRALTAKMDHSPATLNPADYPSLACAYAAFSISADEKHGHITSTGTQYLEAAYFLHAHLFAIPYVNSVQALLLLTIVLRSRDKDGASWATLGQAIRIAQSIGLHRYISRPTEEANISEADDHPAASTTKINLHSRIWWIAYCLERIMELETGRPSAIQDSECDQILPPSSIPQSTDDVGRFDYFEALIGLAKLQTQISDRLYRKKPFKRRTEQLLQDTGMLDRALLDWAEKLPEGIRPGRDIFWDPEQLHFATFLSLHYHQTVIALHRPALMSGSAWLRERVNVYCSQSVWKFRLRYSMCICAASARSIVKAIGDLVYQGGHSRLITVTHIMLAMIVLAIYISKTQSSWSNESDLALLINAAQYAEEQYLQMGQTPEFIRVCTVLRSQISEHVQALKAASRMSDSSTGVSRPIASPQQIAEDENAINASSDDVFVGADFDELWPFLWGNDLNQVYLSGTEMDVLNTHLLGVPPSVQALV